MQWTNAYVEIWTMNVQVQNYELLWCAKVLNYLDFLYGLFSWESNFISGLDQLLFKLLKLLFGVQLFL